MRNFIKVSQILIICILGILPLTATGYNYFQEGTEWLEKADSSLPGETMYNIEKQKLERVTDGSDVLVLMAYSFAAHKEIPLYIISEEDKVYFMESPDSQNRYLMYDFSLQPGEKTCVWSAGQFLEGNLWQYEVECISVEHLDINPEIEVMTMREKSVEPILGWIDWEVEGLCWYRGIGSTIRPQWNAGYDVIGEDVKIRRVLAGGETIFDFKDYVEESGIMDVSWAADNGDAEYYTLQGVKVSEPTKGIFIKIHDGKAEKVFIRQM